MAKKIIVIGSGAAGMSAASAARAADPDAEITVFTEDRDVAYSPCMIPWVLEGRATWDGIIMHDPAWYAKERNIKIFTETKVESAVNDRAKDGTVTKTVTAGGKTYEYDSLVIATGGKVFIPPIEGTQLPGVFTVRTVKGGQELEAYLKKSQKVAVAGAGVIGLELALALVNIGKDVTVIEMMDQVIPRIADRDMAEPVQKYLESKGVKFMMKTPVQGVIGTDKVEAVNAGGQTVPCDMVVFATGVRANVDIADQMGLDKGQMGALLVAPTLQAYKRGRLVPDVFVAGDVMQCQSAVYPGPTMSQLGSSANKEGRIAGANAAGKKLEFGPVASPWVSVIGDLQIAGTGMSLGLASWYGADCVTGKATGLTRARYYPDAREQTVKVIADRTTHRLVGAQILAGEEATGRIDWLTAAIINGTTAEEFLATAENAYCPPTSQVRDVVFAAVEDLVRNL
ncbi:MAG: FAD-dependent oxidoreductase [Candidatus Methanomethylophilus sp.]|nr:FAD-dependent oxidoreductase [Methanomethylophilus sp.]